MPSLSHALVPNSFPLLHLIIYLDSYCTSMVTSNLIVSHHPRPNASYPADLLSHCSPGPLPPNPFICHTSEISPVTPIIATDPTSHVRNSFACHTCKTPRRVLHAAQPFPFPEESVKKNRWHRHSCLCTFAKFNKFSFGEATYRRRIAPFLGFFTTSRVQPRDGCAAM